MPTIAADTERNQGAFDAIVQGLHSDPFSILGLHWEGNVRFVRAFQPAARFVDLIDGSGDTLVRMERVHNEGVFVAIMPQSKRRYSFRVTTNDGISSVVEDAYRFQRTLGDLDLYLLGEGSDKNIYAKLGAHIMFVSGVHGTRFAVWAPNATRVSVVGDFNRWDGRCHIMRLHPGNGIWEIFVPDVGQGTNYKFELLDRNGNLLPLKADPYGQFQEAPPGNASVVYQSRHRWRDSRWMNQRSSIPAMDVPISVYEVHLGSWRRKAEENDRYLTYRELADELTSYVAEMGFTHIELLPITEHPFDGSWGYQPIGMFAPTQRHGTPDEFRIFIDAAHRAGLSVIMDWVPAHFPKDDYGLRLFDGTALYEHEDPRKGEHADWGTLIFNFGRREVVNYLIGNALYWIDEFHIDAIRVDAVASMLYLDYSREDGKWLANEHGGNEHLEAVDFLKRLNTELHAHGATSFAEESTAWPGVSHPVDSGGLGFTYKWNMGWMNDTLSYMTEESIHRKYHHDKMTFGLNYAFTENFVLPLSHDEVVHGKRSLLGKMTGDDWQQFANLRAYFTNMYLHPGKKLLFMGSEIAPHIEWNHDESLPWHLLEQAPHAGMQLLIRDLNALYKVTPALYDVDFSEGGFEWLDSEDRENSVMSWLRRDRGTGFVIAISNFTPVVRHDYRVGVPSAGRYHELLNSDDERYWGSGIVNPDLDTEKDGAHGRPYSICVTLPPLSTLILGITS